jgi:hypothetical protein
MDRVNLKSNNTAVLAGPSPAFKSIDEKASLFGGVQSSSFSIPGNREIKKQVGSCFYAVDDLPRHPDIDLSISYLYSPSMENEKILGLNADYTSIDLLPSILDNVFVSGIELFSNNFYFYNHPDQGSDAIEYLTSDEISNPNNGEIISFGNCFLTDYSVSFQVGNLPSVSTNYKCSNMKAELYTGNIQMPSINLAAGNNIGVGDLDFTGLLTKRENYLGLGIDVDLADPKTSEPGSLELFLEDLQVGGQSLLQSRQILQNFDFNFSLDRVDLYGLGSDYVFNRKVQYPVRGNVTINSVVANYETGFISGMLKDESTYDFTIKALDCEKIVECEFNFDNLKLETFNYSLDVNNDMQYSASFSFAMYNK